MLHEPTRPRHIDRQQRGDRRPHGFQPCSDTCHRSTMDGPLPPEADWTLGGAFGTGDHDRYMFGKAAKKLIQCRRACDSDRGLVIAAESGTAPACEHEGGLPDLRRSGNYVS